jgi:hypothetical protein
MSKKEWRFFQTEYSKAWRAYRKSDEYCGLSAAMKQQGIKFRYRNNILNAAFTAGWNANHKQVKMSTDKKEKT